MTKDMCVNRSTLIRTRPGIGRHLLPLLLAAVVALSASALAQGTGLRGEYYDNRDFTALAVTRVDQTVNFDWGGGSPDGTMQADSFSVRWTGQVETEYSETYTFYTVSDDGIRLWVNGVQIINNWTDHGPTENSGTIALAAGQKYNVVLEFYENGGGAVAKLLWSSPSTGKQAIPAVRLYPAAGVNQAPTAASQSVSTAEDSPVSILLTGSDLNGDPLSFTITVQPAHGTLSGAAPNLTYTPSAGYTGLDSFTFTANDGELESAAGIVSITVGAPVGIVNGSFETPSVGSGYIYNPVGATWTISGAIAGANGAWGFKAAVDGTQVCCIQTGSYASQAVGFDGGTYWVTFYGAQRGYNPAGPQTVQVLVDGTSLGTFKADGTAFQAFSTGVVTPGTGTHTLKIVGLNTGGDSTMFIDDVRLVKVAANEPPTAGPQSVETTVNTAKAIVLSGTDPEDDPLTYAVTTQPAHGTISGVAPNLTYTPAAGYSGSDGFTFTVNDGVQDSGPATVTIAVTGSVQLDGPVFTIQ